MLCLRVRGQELIRQQIHVDFVVELAVEEVILSQPAGRCS